MKYYGERTQKLYDSEKECMDAEFKAKEAENLAKIAKERKEREIAEKREKDAAARKEAANEVETARKAMVEAQKVYREKLTKFCQNYGAYHFTSHSADDFPSFSWLDWLDTIFE